MQSSSSAPQHRKTLKVRFKRSAGLLSQDNLVTEEDEDEGDSLSESSSSNVSDDNTMRGGHERFDNFRPLPARYDSHWSGEGDRGNGFSHRYPNDVGGNHLEAYADNAQQNFILQHSQLEQIARAIRLLYSKNCIVGETVTRGNYQTIFNQYLFDSQADAIDIRQKLIGARRLSERSNVTLDHATGKYGFLMRFDESQDFYNNYSNNLFYQQMSKVLILIQDENCQLSSRTKKFLTKQLAGLKTKYRNKTLSVNEDLKPFEEAVRGLTLPSEIFWAIGGLLLTAALCVAMAQTAVPLAAVVVTGIKATAAVTEGVSVALGCWGLYKHTENKRLVNEALEEKAEAAASLWYE